MEKWQKGVYIKNGIQVANKMAQLYVTYRKKYIVQYYNKDRKDFTYKEVKLDKGFKNSLILKHLRQETTVGIFAGTYITSFMCFDVDIPNQEMAKWTVYKLVYTLQEIGIPDEYIYISLSGSKGYHVDIFFDKPVENSDVQKLYLMVMNSAELLQKEVELRPSETKTGTTLGMKLPLGVNQKTGNICWFCDYEGLKPIKDYDYVITKILDIEGKNKKLLLYAMLIHSKRYANKQGVFFMTKSQMMRTTGLCENTVKNLRKKLEAKEIITITRSKVTKFNKIYNKPMTEVNRYKINLFEGICEILDDNKTFKVCDKDCEGCFNACLCQMYSDTELKGIFARRQFEEIKKFRDYCINV
ncbi:MAG: TOTE conflict system archaeo-eukaryotic primase domain-containing protein [Ruminiclostridium sp.]